MAARGGDMMRKGLFQRTVAGVLLGAALVSNPSIAQEAAPDAGPSTNAVSDCPMPVSIYFGSRETGASPESEAVLDKIHEAVGECAADQIDIIAHVDAGEGDHALGLALQRLSFVADHLVSLGVAADQIRVATEIPDQAEGGSVGQRQIDIAVRKRPAPKPPETDETAPRVILVSPRNLI